MRRERVKGAEMITSMRHAEHRGRPVRPGLRAITVVTATAAVTMAAAAMVPAAALASGGGRAAAGHPPRPASAGHPARAVAAGMISTLAGGVGGPGPATKVALPDVCGLAVATGNMYVGDRGSVRKVSGTGSLTTPAGIGAVGLLGDGGPAARASVAACGISVDHSGNLVIADTSGRVRVVAARTGRFYGQAMTAANIYTVAGGGLGGPGDGGPARAAVLQEPSDVRVDSAGNLVIAEEAGNRIRVVAATTGTFYGQAMTALHIYTVAGNGNSGFSGDGGPATSAELFEPAGLALDAAGNVVIADSGNSRIRVVAVSTGRFYGRAMTAGDIYTVAGGGTAFPGDGGPATSARLDTPSDAALDHDGNLMIADTLTNRIRVVAVSSGTFYGQTMTAGDIYTVAGRGGRGFNGDGGPATAAQLNWPGAVKVDGAGNVLIGDTSNFRVRVLAARTGTFYGVAMTVGDIYTVAGNGTERYSGDGGPASHAQLDDPRAVTEDAAGNVVIADDFTDSIRVVAATTGRFYRVAMTAGDIYTVAGTGKFGFSGDGGPATKAKFALPFGVTVDGAGNLVIADSRNNRVRVVAASAGTFYGVTMTAGNIYTVAGNGTLGFTGDGGLATASSVDFPAGTGVDQAGNLLIADAGHERIRVVADHTGTFYGQAMTTGHIYTVAGIGNEGFGGNGGPATQAFFRNPLAVTVDHAGNVLISDTDNNSVRVVAVKTGRFYGRAMTALDIYAVAGTGKFGFSGDGGPAIKAHVDAPAQVGVDGTGNLVIAAGGNQRIRVVAVKTGTFYGMAMTAGDIYTVAGDGSMSYTGDGGPATQAGLFNPEGVAVDITGGLVIGDRSNHRIRAVSG
jgi:NHL repeat